MRYLPKVLQGLFDEKMFWPAMKRIVTDLTEADYPDVMHLIGPYLHWAYNEGAMDFLQQAGGYDKSIYDLTFIRDILREELSDLIKRGEPEEFLFKIASAAEVVIESAYLYGSKRAIGYVHQAIRHELN